MRSVLFHATLSRASHPPLSPKGAWVPFFRFLSSVILLVATASFLVVGASAGDPSPRFTKAHEERVASLADDVRDVRGLANDVERFAAFTDESLNSFEADIERMAAEAVHASLKRAVSELESLGATAPPEAAVASSTLRSLLAQGHAETSHGHDDHLNDKIQRLHALRSAETSLRSALARAAGSVPLESAAALVSVALREHAAGAAEELLSRASEQVATQERRVQSGHAPTGSGAEAAVSSEFATQLVLLRDLTKELRDEAMASAEDARSDSDPQGKVNERLTSTATQEKIAQVDALLASLARGVQSAPVREAEAFIQDIRDSLSAASARAGRSGKVSATVREAISSLLFRAMHHLTQAPGHKDVDIALDLIEKVLHRSKASAAFAPLQLNASQTLLGDAGTLLSSLPPPSGTSGHVRAARALLAVALRGEAIDKARQELERSISAASSGSSSSAARHVREAQAVLHDLVVQGSGVALSKGSNHAADAEARRNAQLKSLSRVRELLAKDGVGALAGDHVDELLGDIEQRITQGDPDDDSFAAADDDSIDPFTGQPYPSVVAGREDLFSAKEPKGHAAAMHEDAAPVDVADERDATALRSVKHARASVELLLPAAESGGSLSAHSEALNMALNELHFAYRSIKKRRSDRLALAPEDRQSTAADGASFGAHTAALRLSAAQTVTHLDQAQKHLENAANEASSIAKRAGSSSSEQAIALKSAQAAVLEALFSAQEALVLLATDESESEEARALRAAREAEDKRMVEGLVTTAVEALSRVQMIDPRLKRALDTLTAVGDKRRKIGDAERQVNIDNAERLLAEAAVAHAGPEVQVALHSLATFAELRDLENAKRALSHAPQSLDVVAALHDIEEAKLDLKQPGRSPVGLTRERIRRAHGVLIQAEKDMEAITSAGVHTDNAARFLESVGIRLESLAKRGIEHPSEMSENDKELVEAAALVNAIHDVDEMDQAREMLEKLEAMRLHRMQPADKRALLRELEARLSAAEDTVATRRARKLLARQEEHDAMEKAMDKLQAQAEKHVKDPALLAAISRMHKIQESLHDQVRSGRDVSHRDDGHGMGDLNDADGDGKPDTLSFVTHRAKDFVDSVKKTLYGGKETEEEMTARELLEVDDILREVSALSSGITRGSAASVHEDLTHAITAVEELRIAQVRHHTSAAHKARVTALKRLASLVSRLAQSLDANDRSDAFLLSRAERLVRKALTEERVAEMTAEVHRVRSESRPSSAAGKATSDAALASAERKLRTAKGLTTSGEDVTPLLDSVKADLERANAPVPLSKMAALAAQDALREAQRPGVRPHDEIKQALHDLNVIGDADATRDARAVLEGVLSTMATRGHSDDEHARHAPDSSNARQIRELLERAAERLEHDSNANAATDEASRVQRAQLLIDMAESEKAIEAALEHLQPIAAEDKAIARAVKMLTEVYTELDENMGLPDPTMAAAHSNRHRRGEVLRELDQALGDIAMAPVAIQKKRAVLKAERLIRNAYTVLVRHHEAPKSVFYPKTPSFKKRRELERGGAHGDESARLAEVEGLMQQLRNLPSLPGGAKTASARRRELQRSQLLEELEHTADEIRKRRPGDQARRLVLPARATERDLGLGLELSANMSCSHLPGYHIAGKQCVPDSECSSTTCNHHGLCSVVEGSVQCLCDAGFSTVGSRFCSACTARSAVYPDCFTRELTDDFVRDALSADACTAPLMPTSLNAPGLLHSAQRTMHVQDKYFINTAVNSHAVHLVTEEESLLRVHVFAEHGDLLQSARTVRIKLALLDSRTVIHEGSLFFGEQEASIAAILAPGVSYAIVFEYDGAEIQRRSQSMGTTCPTMRVGVGVTPASKLAQYGETAVDDAMNARLTADPTLTHQGTNRNPIAPGSVIADGVMRGDLAPGEAAAVAAGHGACKSQPHIPTFPLSDDGVFDVPPLGFHKDEQLAFLTGDVGRGDESGSASKGSDGGAQEQVVYMLTFDIPEVHERQAYVEASVDFNFIYGNLRMMLRNSKSELLYLGAPTLNGNNVRIPLGPGRYSLTVLLLRPNPAPVPELPFNLPHVKGAAAEHAVTMPECMLYTFRFLADFVAIPELPPGERLSNGEILTEECGYNQLPPHLNVPSLMGYHGEKLHLFDTFRYDPIRVLRFTHFEVRRRSLVRIYVPDDLNAQGVEVRLVHLDHAAGRDHADHLRNASEPVQRGHDGSHGSASAAAFASDEAVWGVSPTESVGAPTGYEDFATQYDNYEGVSEGAHGLKKMAHDSDEEAEAARQFRRRHGHQNSDAVVDGDKVSHHTERGRNSLARANFNSRIVSLGVISKRVKSDWITAEVAPGAYRLDFRVSHSRFLPLTESKCDGFTMELSVLPVAMAGSMSEAECADTPAYAPEIPGEIRVGTSVLGARVGARTARTPAKNQTVPDSIGFSYVAHVPRAKWGPKHPVAQWEFWVRDVPAGENGLLFDFELESDFTRVPLVAHLEESVDANDRDIAEIAALRNARARAIDEYGEGWADIHYPVGPDGRVRRASKKNKTALDLADEVLETVGREARLKRLEGTVSTGLDRNLHTIRRTLPPGYYRLVLFALAPYEYDTVGADEGRPGPADDFVCVEYDMRLRVMSPSAQPHVARCMERTPLRPGLMRIPETLTSLRFLGSDMLSTRAHIQGRYFFPRMQQTQRTLKQHLAAIDADKSHAIPFKTAPGVTQPRAVHRTEIVIPAVSLFRLAIDAAGVPMKVKLTRVLCLTHPGLPLSEQLEGSATRVEPWIKYDMHRTLARRPGADGCVETVFETTQDVFSSVRFLDPGLYELSFIQPAQTAADDAHDAADCVGFHMQLAMSAVHALHQPVVIPEKVFRSDTASGRFAAWEHANARARARAEQADEEDDDKTLAAARKEIDPAFLAAEESKREFEHHANFRPHALLSDLALFSSFIPLCPAAGSDHAPPSPPPRLEGFFAYDSVRRNEHLHLQQRYGSPRMHVMRFHAPHAFRLYARVAFSFLTSHLSLTLTHIGEDGLTEYLGEGRYNRHVIAVDVAHAGEWMLTISEPPPAQGDAQSKNHQGLFCAWFTFRLEIELLPLSGAGPYGGLLPAALNIPPMNLLMSSLERVLPRYPAVPATLNTPAMLVPHHSFHHFGAHSLLPPARRTGTAAHAAAGFHRNQMRFRLLHRSVVRLLVTPAVRPFLDAHFGVKILLDCEACDPVAIGREVTVHTTRHYSWLFGELDVGDYVLTLEPKTSLMPHTWFMHRGSMDVLLELAISPIAHLILGSEDAAYQHKAGLHHTAITVRGRTSDGRFALPAGAGPSGTDHCGKVLKDQKFHVCAHVESLFIQRPAAPGDSLTLNHEFSLCPELHGLRVHTYTLALREQSTIAVALYYDFLLTSLLPTITDVVNGHRWHGERLQNSHQLFAVLPAGYYNLTVDSLGPRVGALLHDPCLRDTYGLTVQVTPVRPDASAADAAEQYTSWAKAQKLAHVQRKQGIPNAALTATNPLSNDPLAPPATTSEMNAEQLAVARGDAGPMAATPAERAQIMARIDLLRAAKATTAPVGDGASGAGTGPGGASASTSLSLSPIMQEFHADAADAQIMRALEAGASCPNPAIPPLLFPRLATVVSQGQTIHRRTWSPRSHTPLARTHGQENMKRRLQIGVSQEGESAEEAAEFDAAAEAATVNALALSFTPDFSARLSMPYVRSYPGDGSVSEWDPESGHSLPEGPVRTMGISTLEESLLFLDVRAHSSEVREHAAHVWSVSARGLRHEESDEENPIHGVKDPVSGKSRAIELLPRLTYEFNRGPRHQKVFWLPETLSRARRGWHQFELELAVTHPESAHEAASEAASCHLYSLDVAAVPVAALQEHLFRSGCSQRLPPAHVPFDERGRGLIALPDGIWTSGLVDNVGDGASRAHGKSYRMRLHVAEDSVVSAQLRFSFVTASFRLIIHRIEDDGEAYEFARARNVPAVPPGRHEVPLGHSLSFDQALDVSLRLPQGNYHVEIQEEMATALHEILSRLARSRAKRMNAPITTRVELEHLTSQPLCVPFAFFFEMTPLFLAREHGAATQAAMSRIAAEAQALAEVAAHNGGVVPGGGPVGSSFSHGESVCHVESCGCRNADVFAHSRDPTTGAVAVPVAALPRGMRADQCATAGSCTPLATAAAKRNAFVCKCATGFGGSRCHRCAYGFSGYPACRPTADSSDGEVSAEVVEADQMASLTSESVPDNSTVADEDDSKETDWERRLRGRPAVAKGPAGETIINIPTDVDVNKAFSNPFVVPFDVHELAIDPELKKTLIPASPLPATHSTGQVSRRTGKLWRPAVTLPTTPTHTRGHAPTDPNAAIAGSSSGSGVKLAPGETFTSSTGEQRRIHCGKPCYRGRCDYTTGRCVSDLDVRDTSPDDVSRGHSAGVTDEVAAETVVIDATPASLLEKSSGDKNGQKMFVDPRSDAWSRVHRAVLYTLLIAFLVIVCAIIGVATLSQNHGGRATLPRTASGWLMLIAAGIGATARHVAAGARWIGKKTGATRALMKALRRLGFKVGEEDEGRSTLLKRHNVLSFHRGGASGYGEVQSVHGDDLSLDDASELEGGGRSRRGAVGSSIARALE